MGVDNDPALREIEEAYTGGRLVLVVGPALPAAAGLSSHGEVLKLLLDRARKSKAWEEAALGELAALVEKEKLPEAFSAAKGLLGPVYGDVIEKALGGGERPVPPLGRAVAALEPKLSAVLTVNVDRFLERAFAGEWPVFVQAPGDLGRRRRFILKLRGTIEQQASWVLTQEELGREMMADTRNEAAFSALFMGRCLLFAGCDLGDPAIKGFLDRMAMLVAGQAPRHFALAPRASVGPYQRGALEKAGVVVVDCEAGEEAAALERLARPGATATPATAAETTLPAGPERCPFPGLEVFEAKDAGDFFGRTAEVSAAVALLGGEGAVHRRWLQIEGPSGAGKSSLARAGVVPAVVEKRWVHGAAGTWRRAVIRPGFDPLRSVALGVLGALGVDEVGVLDRVVEGFRRSDTALGNLLCERLPEGEALLLVVDQLEEAFTLAEDDRLRRFDAVLADALRDRARKLYLVTTIRSDFVGRFEALPGLGALINAGADAGRYLLKPMSGVALREAIEGPAARGGLTWEAGLVDRILEDASEAEGGLPLVAHVLRALWVDRKGRVLGHTAYNALGGVSGALTRSADAIVDGLGEGGRERARRMLLKLVKLGRGTGDGRQAASRREVVEVGGGEEEGERALLGLSGGAEAGRRGSQAAAAGGGSQRGGRGGAGGSGPRGADPALEDASGVDRGEPEGARTAG
jgi:hypothetical protein